MSIGDGPLDDLKVPLRWTAMAAAAGAALIAVGLLLGDRRPVQYGPVRETFDTIMGPLAGAAAFPVRQTADGLGFLGDLGFQFSDYRRVQAENAELRRWRDAAIALRDRNERLSALLQLRVEPPTPMVAAHAISDSRGPFANARLIDAGAERGVRVGHPVLSENGLVGRVVGAARGVSRVMLLTDPASRTPVLVDRTDARAMLTGDGGDAPRLDYLRGADPVRTGDRLLTSGDGGVFPRGLPVGVAVRARDGTWRARLYADRTPIDYVRVLLFADFAHLASQPALNEPRMPPAPAPTAPSPPAPSAAAASPAVASPSAASPAAATPPR